MPGRRASLTYGARPRTMACLLDGHVAFDEPAAAAQ
jgi:hypothetical protein